MLMIEIIRASESVRAYFHSIAVSVLFLSKKFLKMETQLCSIVNKALLYFLTKIMIMYSTYCIVIFEEGNQVTVVPIHF